MAAPARGPLRRPAARGALACLLYSLGLACPAPARGEGAPLPAGLIALDSPAGQELLVHATARSDYFHLSAHAETQRDQGLCGPASVVTVLNALPIPAPVVPAWAPYRAFTQDNVLNDEARR